jgi:hypothetical protein
LLSLFYGIRSRIYAQADLDHNPLVYTSHVTGMKSVNHCAHLFIGSDGGPMNFVPGLTLNYDPPNLCWDYRFEPSYMAIVDQFLRSYFLPHTVKFHS